MSRSWRRNMAAEQIHAGWYTDPEGSGHLRWWDGTQWTKQYSPAASAGASPRQADPANNGLAMVGFITAILIPVVGFVIGLVLAGKSDRRGGQIVGLSVGIFLLFLVAFSVGAHR